MIITLQSLGCKVPSALLLLKWCEYIKKKKSGSLSKVGLLNFWVIFWEKWVVMDSNHRRHSQQIYSLPHLATLVTTQKLYISKASAKVMLLFDITKFFRHFFSLFLQKMFFSPYKIGFSLSFTFYFFTLLPLPHVFYDVSSTAFCACNVHTSWWQRIPWGQGLRLAGR